MPFVIAPIPLFNELCKDVYDGIKKTISLTRDGFLAATEAGISDYYERRLARYEKLHTLLSPHQPVQLRDIFVKPTLACGDLGVTVDSIYDFLAAKRVVVIQGIAGQGKSILIKNLFCEMCRDDHGFIPVFLELRDVDFGKRDIKDVAFEEIFSSNTSYPRCCLP
ncbi:hypothetical protein [Rhizobium tumorigenes]|uniref:NACHT domain-containing protein n=1 Tax=Rhizobium tumorigenes TaxID=2041385 RepID=A0AAF1KD36_9HYPH|nr:hypothetical protein [Rhizobium tumorigenes]WFR97112.1 hypothetical protein PR017_08420 [Rhizobium tumorigenes]